MNISSTSNRAQRRSARVAAGVVGPLGLAFAGAVTPAGAQVPSTSPDSSVPGGSVLQKILGWAMYGGLAICVLAMIVGGAMWGFSQSNGAMGGREGDGKKMVMGGGVGAVIIGVAVAFVNGVFTAAN